MPALHGGHRLQGRTVALAPPDPRAEDVLPDEHPDAVQPGAPELVGVVAIPAARVVEHVPLLEPAGADHAGHGAVGEPLRPREVMVADPREGNGRLALERQPGQRGDELGHGFLHRVEEDAVGAEVTGHVRHRLRVGHAFSTRARIPRVVVDEDAHTARLDRRDELADPGHVAVVVELVSLVDPDHRIGVPEDDRVVAAELALALVEQAIGGEAGRLVVVEEVVPEPDECAGEAALRPGQRGQVVRGAVVPHPRAGDLAPGLESSAPGGPVRRVVGSGQDLPAVENVERPLERNGGRQVDRPRHERVERLLCSRHATARVRATSSSCVIPSKPGSEVANRPWSGADQRSSIGTKRPEDRADGGAVRVGVPAALHDGADRRRELVERVERRGDERRVVDRVHAVETAVAGVELVDDAPPTHRRARAPCGSPRRVGSAAGSPRGPRRRTPPRKRRRARRRGPRP